MSIRTAFFYARKDKRLVDRLDSHLAGLRRQAFITIVHNPAALSAYRLIVLFLSSDFLSDNKLVDVMKLAYQQRGEMEIIPIVLRDVDLTPYAFDKFVCLPRNGKPVVNWSNKDKAFAEISKEINQCITDLLRDGTAKKG